MHRIVWIIVGLTCALGGILLGYRVGVNPGLSYFGLKAFPVVFLGGLESIPGVIIGGVVIGIVEVMVGAYISSGWETISPFVVLFLILVVRPQGFFGAKMVERI